MDSHCHWFHWGGRAFLKIPQKMVFIVSFAVVVFWPFSVRSWSSEIHPVGLVRSYANSSGVQRVKPEPFPLVWAITVTNLEVICQDNTIAFL